MANHFDFEFRYCVCTSPVITPPNIIIIIADDLGYNDLSSYGNTHVHTLNIDSLGIRGVRFTQAYVTSPICAPSRMSIITGRCQQRFGAEFMLYDKFDRSVNKEIKQLGNQEILLFGSPSSTHVLIEQNLIDGYWLFVNPVILGKGISLFKDIKEKIKLNLLSTHQFTNGVTELNYTVDGE